MRVAASQGVPRKEFSRRTGATVSEEDYGRGVRWIEKRRGGAQEKRLSGTARKERRKEKRKEGGEKKRKEKRRRRKEKRKEENREKKEGSVIRRSARLKQPTDREVLSGWINRQQEEK